MAASAPSIDHDATLVALCDELLVLDRECERRMDGAGENEERVEAECQPLYDRVGELARAISAIPATTEEGRRSKAAVARQLAEKNADGTVRSRSQCDIVAHSLVADLLGEGAAKGLTSSETLPTEGERSAHSDNELIAACEEFMRVQRSWDAYYRAQPLGEDGDPILDDEEWNAILAPLPALVERIVALRATTAEGFLARARCRAVHWRPNARRCQDNPEGAWEDRFEAAEMRDLLAERSPMPPHPDAELIRLVRDLDAAQVAIDAYEAEPRDRKSDERTKVVMAPAYAAVDRIVELEARTLDGLIAQARALDWCRSGEPCDAEAFDYAGCTTTDRSIAAAIVRGLLAMGSGRQEALAFTVESHPDAVLIAMAAECDALAAQVDAIRAEIPTKDTAPLDAIYQAEESAGAAGAPFDDRHEELLRAMCEHRAVTLDGHRARLRSFERFHRGLRAHLTSSNTDNRILGATARDVLEAWPASATPAEAA